MAYTFSKNSRYFTDGVRDLIPIDIQMFMWKCIDSTTIDKDFLQIFRLVTKGKGNLIIYHEQEKVKEDGIQAFKHQYIFPDLLKEPINTKVYVIDDIDHSTMLLAEEY